MAQVRQFTPMQAGWYEQPQGSTAMMDRRRSIIPEILSAGHIPAANWGNEIGLAESGNMADLISNEAAPQTDKIYLT
jgi:hypothetical protein